MPTLGESRHESQLLDLVGRQRPIFGTPFVARSPLLRMPLLDMMSGEKPGNGDFSRPNSLPAADWTIDGDPVVRVSEVPENISVPILSGIASFVGRFASVAAVVGMFPTAEDESGTTGFDD